MMDAEHWIKASAIFIPLAGTLITWWVKSAHERRTVAVAIIAEIRALAEIARLRQYVEGFSESADYLVAHPGATQSFSAFVSPHYCRVYAAHVSKLGCLIEEEACLIVTFYQFADAVIIDVSEGGILHRGTENPDDYRDAAEILKKALEIADRLGAKHYAKKSYR